MSCKRSVALLAVFGAVIVLTGLFAASFTRASTGASQNYIVLYKKNATPASASSMVAQAGGALVANYNAIGVVIASSSSSNFAANVMKKSGVQGASATSGFATRVDDDTQANDDAATADPSLGAPAPGSDSLSGLQWDMNQIKAPQARAINGGNSSVLVGDIDTGLDFTHPDLAPNVDFADSASCIGGVPNQSPAAARSTKWSRSPRPRSPTSTAASIRRRSQATCTPTGSRSGLKASSSNSSPMGSTTSSSRTRT